MPPPSPRPRARDLGLTFGDLQPGAYNAITDVEGVRVGHVTRWSDDPGDVARTGVTAIVPDELGALYERPMAAGPAILNGCGELTGSIAMAEWGTLECPIMLTGTSSIGRIYDAVVDAVFAAVPDSGGDDEVVPVAVVGECDDSWLDESRRRHVTVADARAALDAAASGPVAEGVVGAGTGMITMELKAGIGTSSRVLPDLGTVGVLVLANFGGLRQLRLAGYPVGAALAAEPVDEHVRGDAGSCIGVVATDIPLDARQLTRVARRVGLGLARVGSVAGHGSGDIFCAFSTTNRRPRVAEGIGTVQLLGDDSINAVFTATVDATEEAVINALFVADTVTGRDGHVAPGLPVERVLELVGR
jgi:D-aminopeptidase